MFNECRNDRLHSAVKLLSQSAIRAQGLGEGPRAAAAQSVHDERTQHSQDGATANGDAAEHADPDGSAQRSDAKPAVNGSESAAATPDERAVFGTGRVEVELLDGSAKDAKILGKQDGQMTYLVCCAGGVHLL